MGRYNRYAALVIAVLASVGIICKSEYTTTFALIGVIFSVLHLADVFEED